MLHDGDCVHYPKLQEVNLAGLMIPIAGLSSRNAEKLGPILNGDFHYVLLAYDPLFEVSPYGDRLVAKSLILSVSYSDLLPFHRVIYSHKGLHESYDFILPVF